MQLFIALLTNGFALSSDEASWHYIGRNWFRNGLVPYTGGVDDKSPLFFTIFGISDLLFGVNYWFPRIAGTICQSTGIFYVYKIANHIAGRQAGTLAISFYGLSVLWHGVDGRYVSYTETYDALFIILAFYFFVTAQSGKSYFLSGFLAAVGLGFRLSAFFGAAAIFISSVKKGREATILFCVGLASGFLILVLAAIFAGINLHDLYFYMYADNFGGGSTTDHNFLWRMVQFHNLFFYSEAMLFYPLVMVYLFIKQRVDWVVLWSILVFIGINLLGNYARVDLRGLLPPLSLIAAFAVSHLIDLYQISFRKLMLIIWVCFSPKIVEPFLNFTRLFTGEFQKAENFCHPPYIQPDESASRQLGQWVKANTKADELVFVAGGGPQVQAYSERISPSIHFSAGETLKARQRFLSDMRKNKADMILVPLYPEYRYYLTSDLLNYVDSLTAKHYYFVRCMFNYNIYRLKH
ncbi:MAG: glycosyltransferase family 39 protein [Bacteroidetes bacterium]|nr:glycosyltransferase family 39 protein [Bacteroidota bacterium]